MDKTENKIGDTSANRVVSKILIYVLTYTNL